MSSTVVSVEEEQQCIVHHWTRDIHLNEYASSLIQMISHYARNHDQFDAGLCHDSIAVTADGTSASKTNTASGNTGNVMGTSTASPGKVYQWTLKIARLQSRTVVHVGIVEDDECTGFLEDAFWNFAEGFACKSNNGNIYHDGCDKLPLVLAKSRRQSFKEGDVVQMRLDLQRYKLSFWKNDSVGYVHCDVMPETAYRLAVGLPDDAEVELLEYKTYRKK